MRGSFPLPLKYASHAIQVLIVCEDAFSLAGQQVEHPYEPDAHFEDACLLLFSACMRMVPRSRSMSVHFGLKISPIRAPSPLLFEVQLLCALCSSQLSRLFHVPRERRAAFQGWIFWAESICSRPSAEQIVCVYNICLSSLTPLLICNHGLY